MISKGSAPNAREEDYWNWLAEKGCVVCGANPEIHHVKGAKYKLKIGGITTQVGNKYVLPLCSWHHRKGEINVTDHKKTFERVFGDQIMLVQKMFDQYADENGAYPFDVGILDALFKDNNLKLDISVY
jgi:hypothetical protein